jgi:hypothetical protein
MTGYFEELEDELRRAVPLATAGGVLALSPARRRRPRLGTITVALSVAISVLVAVLALTLVHERRPARGHGRAALSRHRRFRIPAGEDIYPLGAVPTKAQLLANFAVLRRAQNGRDRSWRPDCSCGGAARQFYGLTRYAQSLPDGNRAFLDVEQFIYPGQLNMAAGSYVLNFDLVFPNGNTSGAAFGPNTGYLVYPVPDRGPDNTRGIPHTNDWVSVIPDGVTAARWTFACYLGVRVPCAAGAPRVYTVPVIENVAARRIPNSGNCPGCAQPLGVQWLNRQGDVVASFGSRRGNLPAPPFVKGVRGTGDLDVLDAGGIAAARLGQPSAQAIAALGSLLGPAAQTNVPTGGCGIDRESVWTSPAVAEPLTIFQRAGRFIGYRYGAPAFEIGLDTGPGATLRTARGLTISDTIGSARRLYGHRVVTRVSRGNGSWSAAINGGTIGGAVLPIRYPLTSISSRNPIITIEAGNTGC